MEILFLALHGGIALLLLLASIAIWFLYPNFFGLFWALVVVGSGIILFTAYLRLSREKALTTKIKKALKTKIK